MYLFSRTRRADPAHIRGAGAWASEVARHVTSETGRDVEVWTTMMSPGIGQIAWTTQVEHLVELENAQDKLAVSLVYTDLIERGAMFFTGSVHDAVWSPIHGAGDDQSREYVEMTTAVPRHGSIGTAMELGVEAAIEVTRLTGHDTTFASALNGQFGMVAWFSGFDSIDQYERATAKLSGDSDWLQVVDRVSAAFNPGARQALYRRIH